MARVEDLRREVERLAISEPDATWELGEPPLTEGATRVSFVVLRGAERVAEGVHFVRELAAQDALEQLWRWGVRNARRRTDEGGHSLRESESPLDLRPGFPLLAGFVEHDPAVDETGPAMRLDGGPLGTFGDALLEPPGNGGTEQAELGASEGGDEGGA